MFKRKPKTEEAPPPQLRTYSPAQEKLLFCPVDGCHRLANTDNATPTGVLGIEGKTVWVYLCDAHIAIRIATLEAYRDAQKAKRAGKE